MLDDGPHTLESMCKFIQLYLQLLEDDGILIIEDVQSMDWIDILKKEVPNELKQFIKVYDLRHKKNRYDDIVFTVDKRIGKNKIYPSIEFSFGIITDGNNDVFLTQMIDSIVSQQIPSYEIIIVGNTSLQYQTYESIPIKFINFDETIKPGWITRKKNICCNESQYENIVLLHDHIILEPGWYDGFCKYGNNFDICVTKIKTVDGNRFRDYILFAPWCSPHFETGALLPYDFTMTVPVNKLTYISGSYYIVKRGIALKYPLNEGLSWDQTEDLVFCRELSKNNILMLCNSNSSVTCLKNKWQPHWEKPITDEGLKYLNVINSFYCHLQS
jgi:hypothetical protein